MSTREEAEKSPRLLSNSGPRQSVRRVVIAEDQSDHLKWMVDAVARLRPQWEICATVQDPDGLIAALEEHVPSLLILDVHLGEGKSVDVLGKIPYPVPIIFTSGDPSFAIAAYEHAATDYVLKPMRLSRLERSFARIDQLESAREAATQPSNSAWITAKKGEGSVIVHLDEVLYLQSQTKYTRVVMRDGEALIKKGLGLVELQLDGNKFFRIHRGTVVNIEHAGSLQRDDLGRLKLQMRGRSEWLFVSKPYESVFRSF